MNKPWSLPLGKHVTGSHHVLKFKCQVELCARGSGVPSYLQGEEGFPEEGLLR